MKYLAKQLILAIEQFENYDEKRQLKYLMCLRCLKKK